MVACSSSDTLTAVAITSPHVVFILACHWYAKFPSLDVVVACSTLSCGTKSVSSQMSALTPNVNIPQCSSLRVHNATLDLFWCAICRSLYLCRRPNVHRMHSERMRSCYTSASVSLRSAAFIFLVCAEWSTVRLLASASVFFVDVLLFESSS